MKFAINAHGLSLGTTASTAKAGNWVPSWDDVTGKPVVIAAALVQPCAICRAGIHSPHAAQKPDGYRWGGRFGTYDNPLQGDDELLNGMQPR